MQQPGIPFWAWLLLAMAILLEVMGTTALRLAQGWRHPWAAMAMLAFYAASFIIMSHAVRWIPLATSYAIWSGAGTILITLVAVARFNEALTTGKLIGMGLVVIGIILIQGSHDAAPSHGPRLTP